MHTLHKRTLFALAAAGLAALAALPAEAQMRRIAPSVTVPRQATPAGVAGLGTPNPSGLASPAQAQLIPPGEASLTPPTVPNIASPGTLPGSGVVDPGVAQPFTPGGGGSVIVVQSGGAAGAMGTNVMGGAPAYARSAPSAVDIARGFLDADTNRDGELSRAEAQRLGILNVTFDELDRNKDGQLSRFEYEDAFR